MCCCFFQDILVSEGLLDEIGQLLHRHRSTSVIITHSCKIIADLCGSCVGQQVHDSSSHVCSKWDDMICLCMAPDRDRVMLFPIIVFLGCDGKPVFIRTPPGASVSRRVR